MDKYQEIINRHRSEQNRLDNAADLKLKNKTRILYFVAFLLLIVGIYLLYQIFGINLEIEKIKQTP